MSYVDGFLAAVPLANKSAFVEHARQMDSLFLEFGALRVVECWGDDVPHGKWTDFYRAVQAGEDEAVVFSWVEWPDRETRDAGMQAMMDDPRMNTDQPMPFYGKRLIYGGFSPLLEISQGNSGQPR